METIMNIIITIAIILFVVWILGLVAIPGLGWLMNIAITLAIILLIFWLLKKIFKLF